MALPTPLVELGTVVAIDPARSQDALSPNENVGFMAYEMLIENVWKLIISAVNAPFLDVADEYSHFQDGDLLVPDNFAALQQAVCAQVSMPFDDGFCPSRIIVLRPDPKRLDARYLLYFLRYVCMGNFIAVFRQSNKRQFPQPREFLQHLKIPLPPLLEQQSWCRQLDGAFELWRKWDSEAKLRDTTRRLAFHNFFGSTLTMQARWPAVELNQLLGNLLVGNEKLERFCCEKGDWLIRSDNLGCNRILTDAMGLVQLSSKGGRRYLVRHGDVLLSMLGTQQSQTGVALNNLPPAYVAADVAILRTDKLEPGYLAAYLCSGTGLGEIERVQMGLPCPGLTAGAVRAIRVLLPPREIQQKFVSLDRQFEMDCDAAYKRLGSAKKRFAAIADEVFPP